MPWYSALNLRLEAGFEGLGFQGLVGRRQFRAREAYCKRVVAGLRSGCWGLHVEVRAVHPQTPTCHRPPQHKLTSSAHLSRNPKLQNPKAKTLNPKPKILKQNTKPQRALKPKNSQTWKALYPPARMPQALNLSLDGSFRRSGTPI